jgi:glycosyltransferase involved in cell wall biosynthesis
VYGEWPKQSKNIKSFLTATYSENEKQPTQSLNLSGTINFIFVGSLVVGKDPLYAIQFVEYLLKNNQKISLNVYGDGVLKAELEKYIEENHLGKNIFIHGNQNQEVIKKAYQNSHFVILPSKSEGWPKAIAEGMFWGCVPLATAVSCVPHMLDYGNRGVVLGMNLDEDVKQIELLLQKQSFFDIKSRAASTWSRKYTQEVFEEAIKELIV